MIYIFKDKQFSRHWITVNALLVLSPPYPLAVQIVNSFGDGVEYSACFSL